MFKKEYNIYIKYLKQWGVVHNLSTSLDDGLIINNIKDSIEPFFTLDNLKNKIKNFDNFVDIGSGCGYPGLFIALHFPNKKATLVEPRAKRAAFLSYVAIKMGIKNIDIKCCKIQDISNKTFDLIVSRAFINIDGFLNLSKQIRKTTSQILLYKGSSFKDEILKAKKIQNFTYQYAISYNNKNRNFVLIEDINK